MLKKKQKRLIRHKRIRAKIKGTAKIPRLCVFRSGRYVYGQLVDDEKSITLAMVSDRGIKPKSAKKSSGQEKKNPEQRTGKTALAFEAGKLLAKAALAKKIEKVVFDRAGYKYHGRIKSLAEGAREGGLKF
jgi:large subunit ribosomal protein L18